MSEPEPGDQAGGTKRQPVDSAVSGLSTLYCALVVLFVLNVGWVAIDGHYTVPFHDDWRILDDLFSTPLLQWIIEDQNGHRVPLTLALLFVDYTYLGGHMHLLAIVSVLCVGMGVVVLVRALGDRTSDPLARACVAFACFLLCWAASRHDLVWGMNQGTLMAAMWVFVCIASAAGALRKLQSGEGAVATSLLAAGAAAAAATFSQGAGFSAWAGLVAVALVARFPARTVLSIGIGGGLTFGFYMAGLRSRAEYSAGKAYSSILLNEPDRLFEFALAYVGAPTEAVIRYASPSDAYDFALVVGAIGFCAYVAYLVHCFFRRDNLGPLHAFGIGLPAVALAAGVIVALNRLNFPHYPALALRYATFATLFWIGLAFAVASLSERWISRYRLATVGCTGLFIVLSVSVLPDLRHQREIQEERRVRLSYESAMHIVGIRWDWLVSDIFYPDPERTYRVVDRLREDRRSFFANSRLLQPGASVFERYALADKDRCNGAITWTDSKKNGRHMLKRASGWAIDRKLGIPLDQILIADSDGIVRGLGVRVPAESKFAGTDSRNQGYPWTGFLAQSPGVPPYWAYGVLSDSLVCDLKLDTYATRPKPRSRKQ